MNECFRIDYERSLSVLSPVQMPLQDFQKTMQMFEQNMAANNIKQEMMNDAMDAAFEGDDDEEATYVHRPSRECSSQRYFSDF